MRRRAAGAVWAPFLSSRCYIFCEVNAPLVNYSSKSRLIMLLRERAEDRELKSVRVQLQEGTRRMTC